MTEPQTVQLVFSPGVEQFLSVLIPVGSVLIGALLGTLAATYGTR